MRRRFRFPLLLTALAFAAGILAACSAPGSLSADSPDQAFEEGTAAFEDGDYEKAVGYFKLVLDFGRTGELADDAQLQLARAYAEGGQYLLAGSEYTRFIEFYRNDPRVEEAAFERIRAYAELSPPFPLDQTDTRQALGYIDQFRARYSESAFDAEVQTIRERLRMKLANKEYETGRLYERRDLYEAAVLTYTNVLEQYPTSPYADDALLGAIRAQVDLADNSVSSRQVGRYQQALDLYDRFVQLFRSSPLTAEAEALYDRAFEGRRKAVAAEEARTERQGGQGS